MMENQIKDTQQEYRGYKSLITAGILGIILTAVFFILGTGLDSGKVIKGVRWWSNYPAALSLYYLLNSILLLVAGNLLKKHNKQGIYTFLWAVVLIFCSLFIIDAGMNLFFWTILESLPLIFVGAPIAVLVFLVIVIVNIFRVRKWLVIANDTFSI